jgi:hypothetical protein
MVIIDLIAMAVLSGAGYAFFEALDSIKMAYFSVFLVMAITVADITHNWGIW